MKYIILLLFILISNYINAQITVTGKVTDTNNQAIEFANVILLNTASKEIVAGTITDEKGNFTVKTNKKGKFSLQISFVGFENYIEDINSTIDLGNINLKYDTDLDEVVITVRKKIFENKNGNIKVNISNTILSSEPDPINLLSKLPSIQVSPDKQSISYIGRGKAIIYMGNKKLSINELNNLLVSDIKSIEIIKNPSVKYEAEGRTLILITPKNNPLQGFKVELRETLAFKRSFNNFFGVNLNVKKNKFEINGNLEYNKLKPWESNNFNFKIQNKNIESGYDAVSNTKRPQFKIGGGVIYQTKEGDYLSYRANLRTIDDFYLINAESFLIENGSQDNIFTKNTGEEKGMFFSNNLSYNNSLPKINGNLFVGIQFSTLRTDEDNDIIDKYNNSGTLELQQRNQIYEVDVISARLDFEKTFDNDLKWEVGSKIVSADGRANFTIMKNEQPQKDFNSIYDYSENNYAIYTQLSRNVKKIGYSFGIRMETTGVDGGFVGEELKLVSNVDTDFFPKAKVEIPLDSTKTLTINYAKNISRPNYSKSSQLNVYINPFLVIQGNLNLKPTITNEVSLSMNIKNKTISLGYSDISNPIFLTPFYNENDDLLSLVFNNLKKQKTWELSLTYPLQYKFWSSTNVLTGYYSTVEDPSAVVKNSKPYLYYYSSNEFKLPKGYSLSLSGWAITKREEGVFKRNDLFVMNLGLSKTFFGKLNCSLVINDIFKSISYQDSFILNDIKSKGTYFVDYRGVLLSLKYSFGILKKASYNNKTIDGFSRIK